MQVHSRENGKSAVPPAAVSADAIAGTVRALRQVFDSGKTRSIEWRARQSESLQRMLEVEEKAITGALFEDLAKPEIEAWTAEVAECAGSLRYVRKQLKKWMKPERVSTNIAAMPGKSRIVREPLGVVLIIAPWNYPFALLFNPLVGAIAAGNCVVVKPSEVSPATSALFARLLPQYLDTDCVKVIEGGVAETTDLLAQHFDHIFYTGNGTVGRIVMQAAVKNLTPVTLELGGKSPCIVDETADLDVAARRIMWAKFYNCGQTCVAPDYVLVQRTVHDQLVDRMIKIAKEFWGDNPQKSPDLGRIINVRHVNRLMSLLPGSGKVVLGGTSDESDRFIAPTILTDVPEDAPVMRDEIFGPLLPVLAVDKLDQAVHFITARPKPLALYLFSSSNASYETVVSRTNSGGMVLNHALMHLAVPTLPFGGVGESGMGAYHGKASFETFSHRKAVLKKPTSVDPFFMYPPFTESKKGWMRRLL